MRSYLSFVLTLISIIGVLAAHFVRGTDIELLLPSVLGIYVLGRTSERVMTVKSASQDEHSNAVDAIKAMDGKE